MTTIMELSKHDNKLLELSTFATPIIKKTNIQKNTTVNLNITIVENTWDNTVVQTHSVSWDEVVNLLSQHTTILHKSDAMMLIPATFKKVDENYEAAYDNKTKKIKYRADGKPHIRRCKNNLKTVYMLPLDFDGDLTLKEAKERFKQYKYIGYTSSGHRTDRKNGKDAFRILLPFSRSLTAEEYELRNLSIRKWVGEELDQSSADLSRGFYLPTYLHEDRNRGHKTWHNDGELLDPDIFEEAEKIVYEPKKIIKTGICGKDNVNGEILWDTLDIVNLFQNLGLYVGREAGNRHLVKCPWESEHSSITSGTAIWEGNDVRPGAFKCLHGSCTDRKLFDVTQMVKQKQGMDFLKQFYEILPYKNDLIAMIKKLKKEIGEDK